MSDLKEERQQIRWIRDAIEKGYDWPTLEMVLRDEKYSNKVIEEIKELFLEESEESGEKLKLGFREKLKIKRVLKQSEKRLAQVIENLEYLKKTMKKKEYQANKELIQHKREMIDTMFGVPEKGVEGMLEIFYATDEDGNEIHINKEEVEAMSVDEVTEMFEDLIYEFRRNT